MEQNKTKNKVQHPNTTSYTVYLQQHKSIMSFKGLLRPKSFRVEVPCQINERVPSADIVL